MSKGIQQDDKLVLDEMKEEDKMKDNDILEFDEELLDDKVELEQKHFVITNDDMNLRIDKWLHVKLPDVSRAQIQLHIQNGYVTVNGENVKANYKVNCNDHINIQFPEPEKVNIKPENINLDIVYEDTDLIVVNKSRGMVVHPAQGHYSGTLVNALLYHCKDLSGINGELRPGIVHRIDKDTTGLLVAAKNDFTHKHLSEQFKQHTINRKYIALVHGLVPHKEGTIIAAIGRHATQRKKMAVDVNKGKSATTHFKVIQHFSEYTLLELQLETGRTHQIRVHMSYIGHPIAGDPVYGYRKTVPLEGQVLHAKELGFCHPRTGEQLHFSAEAPKDFQEILAQL